MSMSEPVKYSELRAKTDRQLAHIIERTLDRGLNAARRLETANGNAATLRASAETLYAEAATLLPLIYGTDDDHPALENKLQELRGILEYEARPRVRTAGM